MAQSNAELAERIIRNRGELLERLDPEIVWDNTHNVPPDHHGIQRGKAAVARIITEWVDSWVDYRVAVEEVIEAGDDVVLVVTESGRGRQSGLPLEHRHCYVWSFRDGRIVWGTERGTRAEAIELVSDRRLPRPVTPPLLILASASPRRREILASLGVAFEVVVPGVEEVTEGPPEEAVLENAVRKARAGAGIAGPGSHVLGADTDVVLDGRTLGKPADEGGARERLEALSGRTHEVLSAIAVIEPGGDERTALERSLVTFRTLDDAALELYLGSGEWRDRAGGYAIQGLGSILIERLEGDFSNVVGLPVGALLRLVPGLAPKP